jgi:hypothetical protein
MISHKYGCIFIHIPKCAGTSIEAALGHLEKHSGRGGQDHRNIRMIEKPFITPATFSSKENIIEMLRGLKHQHFNAATNPYNKHTVTRKQYNKYFRFTIVRNPWARAFSWYKNVMRDEIHQRRLGITNEISLTEFLLQYSGKGLLKPQTDYIKNYKGEIPLDYIGRFENLKEDFEIICNHMNIPVKTLPHKTKGSGDNYCEFYDEVSENIIADIYKEEIRMFGYTFNER